ncbi:MAG: nuclear transport factor 2 family protein [Actinomycetota bacterium]
MSRENVEAAARLYDLYERGDIDGMLAGMDPEVEVDVSDRLPDEGVFRGRKAYRSFLEGGFDVWAEFRVEVEELLDAGDAVVSFIRSVAVGHGSGAEVEERIAHVAWMRDGTPYRVKVFADRERALEAAGLSERS